MSPPDLSRRGLAAALAALAGAPARAEPTVEPRFRLPPPRPDGTRHLALTLDACGGGFDRRVADTLLAHAIPAAIFATGLWLRANPEPLRLLASRPDLFAIENHGARHLPCVLGTGTLYGLPVAGTLAAIRAEIEGGADAVAAATGRRPAWFRGAAARYSPAALPLVAELGQRLAAFSLNADEGASLPGAAVARRLANAPHGAVILGHINQPTRPSGAGLAAGIAALHSAGARFVSLSALDPQIEG